MAEKKEPMDYKINRFNRAIVFTTGEIDSGD